MLLYLPLGQLIQLLPLLENLPIGHNVHTSEPALEIWPIPHSKHNEEVSEAIIVLYLPGSQSLHILEPLFSLYLPV